MQWIKKDQKAAPVAEKAAEAVKKEVQKAAPAADAKVQKGRKRSKK